VLTAGEYLARDGRTLRFSGPAELGKFLAESPEAHDAFIQHLFHHLAQQPERAYGKSVPDALRSSFQSNQFDIRKLAVEIATQTANPPRQVAAQNTPETRKP